MDGHVRTFERFGGLARECKYDNQKPVVLRWEGRQPIYNPRYLAFATHYGMRPFACRPGHPNDKPRVERSFWEFERSFLNGRSFRNADDMRAQLLTWCDRICDRRPHKKLKRQPIEMFAEEAPHLLTLPRHPYDTARVSTESVPLTGTSHGTAIATRSRTTSSTTSSRSASRSARSSCTRPTCACSRRTNSRHEVLVPTLVVIDCIDLQTGGASMSISSIRASTISASTALRISARCLDADRDGAPITGDRVLLLRERYDTDDLLVALKQANAYGALEHTAVERILEATARPRTLAEYIVEQAAQRIEQRLGREQAAPRDLAEYDRLPRFVTPATAEESCDEKRPPNDDPTRTT